jgi:galactose-1-phosphate uridylyltransferase (family 1)
VQHKTQPKRNAIYGEPDHGEPEVFGRVVLDSLKCVKKYTLGRASRGRRDALNGRWVIFAPGRSDRPAEILEAELPVPTGHACPFCAGNEAHTPNETYSVCDPYGGKQAWTVRVVPNLFPAVSSEDSDRNQIFGTKRSLEDLANRALDPVGPIHFGGASFHHVIRDDNLQKQVDAQAHRSHLPLEEPWGSFAAESLNWQARSESHGKRHSPVSSQLGSMALFEECELHGGHEVIVETPNHVESLTSLSGSHAAQVFSAYAERIRYWQQVPGIQYVVVFKNAGAAAGASLRHTHSQLIATSLLPPAMQEIGQRMQQHFNQSNQCLLCDMLQGEMADASRIVSETERFVAFCPFASRLPYLVRILPKRHVDRFEHSSFSALSELSLLTQQIVRSLESMFVACAYNYTIHTRPPAVADKASFHWWMEIFPRLTKVAGFEWGSDCYINPITPEVAAQHLRGEPNFSG